MMIEGNDHRDSTRFVHADTVLHPTECMVTLADAIIMLDVAIRKYGKTYQPSLYYKGETLAIALRVLDEACSLHDDLKVMQRLLRKYHSSLPNTYVAFDAVAAAEAEKRYLNCKATIIQRRVSRAIVDPSYELCRRRLQREFDGLMT
jgi:hypothetical protein